ncbi:MAG: NAD-dependent epimerase/dehydratase family protein [Ilumatobacteraceae bacterium]
MGEPVDVVVHLGSGDHDAIALARQSVTEGVVEMLAGATVGNATHVVLVSSAMVYGAVPNNPVPLTEEAVLRPEVEFVYARQLATAEALVDQWRRDDPGRTATVLRPGRHDGRTRLLVAGEGARRGFRAAIR